VDLARPPPRACATPGRCGGIERAIGPAYTALTWHFPGADDGIRTRDPHLGKVAGLASLTCGVALPGP